MEEGRGGGVGEEDIGDGMQCNDHPFRNNPGGICAFCLQEKLGKLVSSSFPVAVFPSSSSSSSPSFRSDVGACGGPSATSLSLSVRSASSFSYNNSSSNNDCHYHQHYSRRVRIPFMLALKMKKKKEVVVGTSSDQQHNNIVFKRSKSTTTPRRAHFLDTEADEYSSQKRGFWSFLYLSKSATTRRVDKNSAKPTTTTTTAAASAAAVASFSHKPKDKGLGSSLAKKGDCVDENDSPNTSSSSFGRKVSRSRSVGCGSRSFSGDFFERISTGFGDCTLRRVESQREGKPKVSAVHRGGGGGGDHHCIKERVKCGGIFRGFIMTSGSSSSSSSSSYWVSSSAEDNNINGKSTGPLAHGRSKSWGWAFASPIRAFSKPSSSKVDGKRGPNNNATPNLAAIPSLLAVRG